MIARHMLRSAALFAATLVCSAPAAAEVTRADDSGFVSRHVVVVEASPKDVWLALISPSGWWRAEHTWSGDSENLTLTPQAGGCFCETIPEVEEAGSFTLEGSVEHMRVIQSYPEAALRMQGALGPLQSEPVMGVLTIVISKAEGGTQIVWEYNVGGPMRYEVPVISKAVDGVMGMQIAALAKLLGPTTLPEPAAGKAGLEDDAEAEPDKAKAKPAEKTPASSAPAIPLNPKPAGTPSSVEDAFGDLEDETKG